ARTTGRGLRRPGSVLPGVPTREDDGLPLSKTRNRGKWGPYARGRRDRDRCRTLGAAVGSLRTRTTGRCRTAITPYKRAPRAQGRRIRHHQTRAYETRPRRSWKQPHSRKDRATLMQHIGDRIREYRMLHGLTQEDLAEKAGMHPNTIKKLEQGGTARMDTLHRIARALNTAT